MNHCRCLAQDITISLKAEGKDFTTIEKACDRVLNRERKIKTICDFKKAKERKSKHERWKALLELFYFRHYQWLLIISCNISFIL